ncbi:unnamed protein product [Rhizophagus irregularis]|nr:unnamed protein product [Rhizophagus irregularis]CAB5377891.1 unnamed protein product [Rhizophagus irregularis]
MPALPFDWNIKGFNDTAVANCPNGVVHQIQAAVIANLVANGATNHGNKNILFSFFETRHFNTLSFPKGLKPTRSCEHH